jgi:hypothetical protein
MMLRIPFRSKEVTAGPNDEVARLGLPQQTRSLLKLTFPRGAAAYTWVKDSCRNIFLRQRDAEVIFSEIYEANFWGNPESASGRGSTLERTTVIRRALPALLNDVNAKSLLDAPCGDFNWMRHTNLGSVTYTGADVVPGLITRNQRLYGGDGRGFILLDITRDAIPSVSVILCRDCFTHLSFRDASSAIANFMRSNSEYLFATTHTVGENRDIATGEWRNVNLQLPPFNFPKPMKMLIEDPELGKCLGVWRLEQLLMQ